jgi:hypothetical protein
MHTFIYNLSVVQVLRKYNEVLQDLHHCGL